MGCLGFAVQKYVILLLGAWNLPIMPNYNAPSLVTNVR